MARLISGLGSGLVLAILLVGQSTPGLAARPASPAVAPAAAAPATPSIRNGVELWKNGDWAGAVAMWQPFANAGDADALFNIGQAYKLGRGVARDPVTARDYYRKASLKGHLPAQANLGISLFQAGEKAEAIRWLKTAADKGEPRAQYVLGVASWNGDGTPRNMTLAYAYLARASAQGLDDATKALAGLTPRLSAPERANGWAVATSLAAGQGVPAIYANAVPARAGTGGASGAEAVQKPLPTLLAETAPPPSVLRTDGHPPEVTTITTQRASDAPKPTPAVPAATPPAKTLTAASLADAKLPPRAAPVAVPAALLAQAAAPKPTVVPVPRAAPPVTTVAIAASRPPADTPPPAPIHPAPSPSPSPSPAMALAPAKPVVDAIAKPLVPATKAAAAKPVEIAASDTGAKSATRYPPPEPKAKATKPQPVAWRVQLGAFAKRAQAEAAWGQFDGKLDKAQKKALLPARPIYEASGAVTKLQLGPYANKAAAKDACARIAFSGRACFVTEG